MTLSTLLEPGWLVCLLVWCFLVLSAAQLTIRLIMAYSVRQTAAGALVLAILALPIAAVYDLALGPDPSLSTRLTRAPIPMLLMGVAGLATSRWVLQIKRLRGQLIAALMIGVLDVHVFTLLTTLAR